MQIGVAKTKVELDLWLLIPPLMIIVVETSVRIKILSLFSYAQSCQRFNFEKLTLFPAMQKGILCLLSSFLENILKTLSAPGD